MRIRLARRSDIPTLASIASAAFLHEPIYDHFSPLRFQYPDDYHTFWVNFWRGKLASAGNTVFVAQTDASDEGEGENRKEVVGFSTWYRTGSIEELLRWNTDSWSKSLERLLLGIQQRYNSFFSFDRTTCNAAIDDLHSQGATWDTQFPSMIHLNIIGVSPDHQRKGIGQFLLEHGMQGAKEEGMRVMLEATASGVPLYTKKGFLEVGRTILPAREEGGRRIEGLELPIMVWDPDSS
ncbi:hypothetical protein MMC14_008588 [Varicellaria rhodocarpa]|nr:hypothetical protein [Varicellaria rhodocarpa]